MAKHYSFRKAKSLFYSAYKTYNKKKETIPPFIRDEAKTRLLRLQEAIISKNREEASKEAALFEAFSKSHFNHDSFFKRELKHSIKEIIEFVLIVAFLVIPIRQMWFEFYEIPTGSMRPTLKEKDGLLVSKTAFGINIPLTLSHFYFDPSLVERNRIIVFSGKDMDIQDVDTVYFFLFPGKKQFIKRVLGLPGDKLYFYGGQIYGIDKEGHDITPQLQPALLEKIDHVPYIHLEGKVEAPAAPQNGVYSPVMLYQMNMPVAKMQASSFGRTTGEVLYGSPKNPVQHYFDLWGFKNYAMARLLTKEQLVKLGGTPLQDAPLYLELMHHPDITKPTLTRDIFGRFRPMAQVSHSFIPLSSAHMQKLFDNLYTARFFVKNGMAYRYGFKKQDKEVPRYAIPLSGIPDGTYEFYYGTAYKVGFGGITKKLPKTHPIYQYNMDRLLVFFNAGMEFDKRYLIPTPWEELNPSRYAYFRNGALYVMGAPIFESGDPLLQDFIAAEQKKKLESSSYKPYFPFVDSGPPLSEDGTLDTVFIEKYGVEVPEKHYLALGDNYAMSADSRDFGFVPQGNLKGSPDLLIWPLGTRLGPPLQPKAPFLNLPRLIVWGLAALIIFFLWRAHRKKTKLPKEIE